MYIHVRKSCSWKNFLARLACEVFNGETRKLFNVAGKLGKLKLNPILMDFVKSLTFQHYPHEQNEKEKVNGLNALCLNHFLYFIAFMFPINIIILVAPRVEIPPHTWILAGCLGHGFNSHTSFSLRKHNLPWWSSCTVHSSVNMTSSNCSLLALCF